MFCMIAMICNDKKRNIIILAYSIIIIIIFRFFCPILISTKIEKI